MGAARPHNNALPLVLGRAVLFGSLCNCIIGRLFVRPPLRFRVPKSAFRSPSVTFQGAGKSIPFTLRSAPTSLHAHSATLPLHSDLTPCTFRHPSTSLRPHSSLPIMQLHSCCERGYYGLLQSGIIVWVCSAHTTLQM